MAESVAFKEFGLSNYAILVYVNLITLPGICYKCINVCLSCGKTYGRNYLRKLKYSSQKNMIKCAKNVI